MKFGVRECCDVVFRAKAKQKVGNKWFYKDEPVIYFDSLKTSSLEGAANTVYATGGRGNAQLMAWEGERTLKFTMEDALISAEGLQILTGAGIIDASTSTAVYVHATESIEINDEFTMSGQKVSSANSKTLTFAKGKSVDKDKGVYMMLKDSDGNIVSEPFSSLSTSDVGKLKVTISESSNTVSLEAESNVIPELPTTTTATALTGYVAFLDYYIKKTSGAYQIDIKPDQFGGYFYIEAETLFRDQATGVDMPAEFIIPNGKVQSNFTFTMAGSGDPSTFTFTIDAFPGKVKGGTENVLASIQVIDEGVEEEAAREATATDNTSI